MPAANQMSPSAGEPGTPFPHSLGESFTCREYSSELIPAANCTAPAAFAVTLLPIANDPLPPDDVAPFPIANDPSFPDATEL